MTQILNLDEIPNENTQKIIYQGETHVFEPLTVGEFIQTVRQAEEMKDDDGSENNLASRVTALKEAVGRSFPTLKDKLDGMKFDQLLAIFNFMSKTAEVAAQDAVTQVAADVEASAEGNG